jgi:hypothetical protein
MAVEKFPPGAVAELGCAGGRVDDVREKHRGENAVRLRLPFSAGRHVGEELVELPEEPVRVAELRSEVAAGQFHQPRSRNVLGVVAAFPDVLC